MKTPQSVILCLLLGISLHGSRAQEASPLETTNAAPATVVTPSGLVSTNRSSRAQDNQRYHLDTAMGYRQPFNGDYDWLTLATVSFGGMLDEHNSLDAVFGGGVFELKGGSQANAQAHQPFFLELGVAWRNYPFSPEAGWKPYVTASASVMWMTWEYRSPVNSSRFGDVTRDYLEGLDGYAGVGLSRKLWRKLDCFGEFDVGGVGFLPTTYSGVHNNLFANFGYWGVKAGLSLKF